MKTINRVAAVNGNGHLGASVKQPKKPKSFRFQIEHCPNPDIVIIHARKKFPVAETDPLMRSSFDKRRAKKENEGNKHPLIARIRRIKGVLKIGTRQYELRIEKVKLFDWEEILPKVRKALKQHFADGLELDELPSHRPSAEVLTGLRLQGCDV